MALDEAQNQEDCIVSDNECILKYLYINCNIPFHLIVFLLLNFSFCILFSAITLFIYIALIIFFC